MTASNTIRTIAKLEVTDIMNDGVLRGTPLTHLDGWYTKTFDRLRIPKALAGSKKNGFSICQIIQDLIKVGDGEIRRWHR